MAADLAFVQGLHPSRQRPVRTAISRMRRKVPDPTCHRRWLSPESLNDEKPLGTLPHPERPSHRSAFGFRPMAAIRASSSGNDPACTARPP
jgi:hypothetical protein